MRTILALLFLAPQICLAQGVGDSVMPKVDTDIFASGKKVIDYSIPLTVKQIEDEWLDVGYGWIKKKNVVLFADAQAYYDDFLSQDSQNPGAFYLRGLLRAFQGELESAIKDFDESIRFDPTNTVTLNRRGELLKKVAEYDKAVKDFRAALQIDEVNSVALTNLAWILATCPDENLLNGSEAIEHATLACERTYWNNGTYLTTLAAAHAEEGNFDEAIEQLNKAIELEPDHSKDLRQEMLDRFKQGKPYRMTQD